MSSWLKKKKRNDKTSRLKDRAQVLHKKAAERIKSSLKLEILYVVAVAFGLSAIAFLSVKAVINHTALGREKHFSYEESKTQVQEELLRTVSEINRIETKEDDPYKDLSQAIFPNEIADIIRNNSKEEGERVLEGYLRNAMGISTEPEGSSVLLNSEGKTAFEELYGKLAEIVKRDNIDEGAVKQEIIAYYEKQGPSGKYINELKIKRILFDMKNSVNGTSYLIDGQGKIMYQDGFVEALDTIKVIQKVNSAGNYNGEDSFSAIYPVTINGEIFYLFNESTLSPNTHYYYNGLGSVIGFIAAVGVFVGLLFRFVKPKIDYLEYLSHCLEEISKGDLNYRIEEVGMDELAKVAKNITYMESEINLQIEAQMKAEKTKNELVTNVAHDLRTPLTSIIGYIGLVKDRKFASSEEEAKYLEIAYTKAEKLKVLIEDLFELTKLHQQKDDVKKEIISVTNLINQLIEEMMISADEKNIHIETLIMAKEAKVRADVPKITRVFENLIENAVKYSAEGENIYVELKELEREVNVTVSNRCHDIPAEEIDRVFERFYRADKSRNSTVGGSGLGLAIAKNIVELHGGKITAKLTGDLISFKVRLPKYKAVTK